MHTNTLMPSSTGQSCYCEQESQRTGTGGTRANAFAAAFLMPSSGIEWFLGLLEKGEPSRRYHTTYDVAGDQQIEALERPAPGSQEITYQDVA